MAKVFCLFLAQFFTLNIYCQEHRIADKETENFNSLLKGMSLSPNPADERIFLQFHSSQKTEGIISFTSLVSDDVRKEQVKITEGYNSIELSTTEMKAGIYIITVTFLQEQLTKKICIQ